MREIMSTFLVRIGNLSRAASIIAAVALAACSTSEDLPPAKLGEAAEAPPVYRIGPGDELQIFVWRNPELTITVPVRPDGRVTIPLIEDLEVTNKTPTELAREVESRLSVYIQDPLVSVIVSEFVGPFTQQVRVVGEAAVPQAIPYSANMTILDVMIAVGGLTEFADGNDARIVRLVNGEQKVFRARLDDLMKDGEISANVALLPGDVVIIPESFF
jgi:polysaccharide export outer membrane protein